LAALHAISDLPSGPARDPLGWYPAIGGCARRSRHRERSAGATKVTAAAVKDEHLIKPIDLATLEKFLPPSLRRPATVASTLARNDPGLLVGNDPLSGSRATGGSMPVVVSSQRTAVGDAGGRCAQEATVLYLPTMVPA